jgi:aspartyl-tRNA synthetase
MNNLERILIKDAVTQTGQELKLAGWVECRRDHGQLIFIDLRDDSDFVLQVVFTTDNKNLLKMADSLRINDVVEISGVMKKRPEKMQNPELKSGEVEFEAKELNVFKKSETTRFELDTDVYDVNEEI